MPICTICNRSFGKESALAQHCKDKPGHNYVAPRPQAPTTPAKAAQPATPAKTANPAPAPKPVQVPSTTPAAEAGPSKTTASSTPLPTFECKPCCLLFAKQADLDEHKRVKHPVASTATFACVPCSMQFSSSEALSIHMKYFSSHPKCPQCNSAFIDQSQLDMHLKLAHPAGSPKFKCTKCECDVALADREKHFRESPNHPVCSICNTGFLDDAALSTHLSSAHIEFRCSACQRQFRSREDLQQHFLTSPMHPHCALCEIGFIDDPACDKHMEINHPRPPPRLPTPSMTPTPVTASVVTASVSTGYVVPSHFKVMELLVKVIPSSVEVQRSTQSSPLVQRPSLSIVNTAVTTVLKEKSEIDDDSYETVEASSHVQRAVSEPTLPTASSMGPSSVQGVQMYASRSPTVSEQSFDDMVRKRGSLMRHPDSESTLSIRSVSTESSHSYLRSPIPVTSTSEARATGPFSAVVESTYGVSESELPQAPRPPLFPQRRPSVSSVSVSERMSQQPHASRAPSRAVDAPTTRSVVQSSTHSRAPTPASARTPIRPLASRPLSRVSVLSASRQPTASPSQKPSTTAVEPALLSDSEGTVEAAPVAPKLKGVARTPGKPGAVSWHCRSCLQDPCVAPTATVCGHIFCTACIIQELAKTGACPVCGKLMLLRLHVETD
ncbi:hypothetical protein C8Q77DRAFT_1156178 [Trametes polyzona]|nr:hypothetical protein C8Q77DRAFT_1156178 [Trametes polyzona]